MKKKANVDVKLPQGVSLSEWSLEKARWQNPRIRAFLGCIRVLDEVFESNYAILHCSPRRLDQVWEQIRKITRILKDEVAPLLKGQSHIPELEQARESADMYLNVLDKNLLRAVERFPERLDDEHHDEARKLLCVAIGQLHAFLLDTLGEILARDPRSHGDTDYFLTRKFARDVDEAEWLHTSVSRLEEYLANFTDKGSDDVIAIGRAMTAEGRIPTPDEWRVLEGYLEHVAVGLVKRLKMILGLRGMRLSELELLDGHASRLPATCGTLSELYRSAIFALDGLDSRLDTGPALEAATVTVQLVFSERILTLLHQIHDQVRDLSTYLPVWRQCIENRRAMMLRNTKLD